MKVDFNNNIPIYIQVINIIKKDIVSGNLKEGDKLPSVREIAKDLKVNPNTISRSYKELEREQITYTKRGMGTFISEDKNILNKLRKDMASEYVDKFISNMKDLGFDETDILEVIKKNIIKED